MPKNKEILITLFKISIMPTQRPITKQKLMKYIKFLDDAKKYVGLSEYEVTLATETVDLGENFAEVTTDIYEKTLRVSLTQNFLRVSDKRKMNILLHEMVHGRICIFNEQSEKLVAELEEELANDITRGFERIGNLTF
jgi:hypothetical protein